MGTDGRPPRNRVDIVFAKLLGVGGLFGFAATLAGLWVLLKSRSPQETGRVVAPSA